MKDNAKYQSIMKGILSKKTEDTTVNDHVLILDGLNTFIRVFSSVPALNDDGAHVGGVIGFLKSLAYMIRIIKPTRCIIVFDGKGGSTRRRKLFPGYKGNRVNRTSFNRFNEFADITDEQSSMRIQMQRLVEYLMLLPVSILSIDYIEADDAIAYISRQLVTKRSTIVSTDKDFLQLVNETTEVWNPTRKLLFTPEKIKEDYLIIPENMLLFRTFDGDGSDCIPGVKGIGIKTLIKHFPDIVNVEISQEELLAKARVIKEQAKKNKKVIKAIETIITSEPQLDLNYKLMQLEDVDISASIKSSIRSAFERTPDKLNKFQFRKMFVEDRLHLIIKNFDPWLSNSFGFLNNHT